MIIQTYFASKNIRLPVVITVVIAVSLVLGFIAEQYFSKQVNQQESSNSLQQLVAELDASLFEAARHNLASAASLDYLKQVVTGEKEPDDPGAIAVMQQVRSSLNSVFVYLLDQSGTTVACTPYDGGKTLTGKNYAFRPYFKDVIESGQSRVYQALGVTTNKRGLYVSVPVFDPKATPTGALVTKFPLEGLDASLAKQSVPTALVSPDGIVFATNIKAWMYKSLYPIEAQRRETLIASKQFGRQPLEMADIALQGQTASISGKNYAYSRLPVMGNGWHIVRFYQPTGFNVIIFVVVFVGLVAFFSGSIAIIYFYLGLRSSEKRFRTLFEKSAQAYLLMDGDRFVDCNLSTANMLGSTREYILNKHPSELSPQYQPGGILSTEFAGKWIAEAMSNGVACFEWMHQKLDGSNFMVEVTLTPLEIDGRTMLFTSWNDIQAKKQAEAEREAYLEELQEHREHLEDLVAEKTVELHQAIEIAETANKEKSRFLANMSHELRTPMHAILSFTNLALKYVENEKVMRFLQNIRTSGIRLTGLLDDLLDLSKLESGNMHAEFIEQDMLSLIVDVISGVDSLLDDKNISVDLEADQSFDCMIDQKLMTQVLVNLFSNAIKFSPENSVIKVHLDKTVGQLQGQEMQVLEISVTDEGVGIPEEELTSVFDQFVQSTKTRTEAGGTGLGLPICKQIITLHHGDIWAESPPGNRATGTTFNIRLPVLQKK